MADFDLLSEVERMAESSFKTKLTDFFWRVISEGNNCDEELLDKGKHLNIFKFHVSKDNTIVLDHNSSVELTSEEINKICYGDDCICHEDGLVHPEVFCN